MPGKGAARSRSQPRERPSSSLSQGRPSSGHGSRPSTPNNGLNSFAFSKSSFPPPRPSSRSGSSSPDCCAGAYHAVGEKCICGICTCGRHKCPVQQKTNIFYGGESHFGTTTGAAFINHDPSNYATRSGRTQQVYSPGERFEHTTTHQADFPWHEHERSPSSLRGSNTMQRSTPSLLHSSPDNRMDLTTSYGAQFVEHPIPSKSMKPAQATYSYGSPRELLTTKQLDYNGLQPSRCPATVLPPRPGSARSGHVKYNMDLSGTWS